MEKQIKIFLGVVVLSLFIINFISAEMLVSEANVSYDSQIVEYFNNQTLVEQIISEGGLKSKPLEIVNDEIWIKVVIRLRNASDVNLLLSSFSENEIKNIVNRPISPHKISAKITEETFNKLIQDNRVNRIDISRYGVFALNETIPLINADDVWNNLNYTGQGVKVCVIDSGVDNYHPDLFEKVVAEKCYCREGGGCCPGGLTESSNATDEDGHGTNVAGIIASQDLTNKGISYGAEIYAVKKTL